MLIPVHIPLCCLMHGLTVKFDFGEVNLVLRYITLNDALSLPHCLGSFLCMVQENRGMIVGVVMGFMNGVTIVINKKLCCID